MKRNLCWLGWGLVLSMCSLVLLLMSGQAEGAESITLTAPKQPARPDDTFVRMFPGLPPFAPATDEMREKARKLGEKDGILDAKDQLTDPIASILNPGPDNPDNPAMTAGVTFLGQFIDHDLTLIRGRPCLRKLILVKRKTSGRRRSILTAYMETGLKGRLSSMTSPLATSS